MAIEAASFKAAFPEFNAAPNDLVTAKLAYASALTPDTIWGDLKEQGAFLYCARFLSLSPFGRKIGLVNEKLSLTNYDADLDRLKRMVTSGYRAL